MKQPVTFKHEFVQFIPEELQEGTVYVSIRFATVSHLCACGCKTKVVTPLKPTDWKLTFDGKTISLHPSIGNWNFPCRSHYWIRNNDRQSREKYFDGEAAVNEPATPTRSDSAVPSSPASPKRSWWRSLWPW
jgi:hypothetical protein